MTNAKHRILPAPYAGRRKRCPATGFSVPIQADSVFRGGFCQ